MVPTLFFLKLHVDWLCAQLSTGDRQTDERTDVVTHSYVDGA